MDAQRAQIETESTWVGLLRALSRCGRLAQRALAVQLDASLSPSQAMLLWTCHELESQDASQLELARHVGVSPGQISGLVEELRRRDLIASERSPRDRRRQTWRLTHAGRELVRELNTQLESWTAACCDDIGTEMLEEMSRGIQSFGLTARRRTGDRPA